GVRHRRHHRGAPLPRQALRPRPAARGPWAAGALRAERMRSDYDFAVVGGGLVGAAVAWGLARQGQRVTVLDEGDLAKRASRANFALVWVQSKGLGMAEYMGWTVRSSQGWHQLADDLRAQTELDVSFRRPGGFHLALGKAELERCAQRLQRLHAQ